MSLRKYDYLILGGGVAGAFAAYSIRKYDKDGDVVIVGAETHPPYDRVPLSKEFVRWERGLDELFFRKESYYRKKRIELLLGKVATDIDSKRKRVKLDDTSEVAYKKLLIATGGRPRKLDLPGSHLDGVFYLRTIEDSIAIRQRMHDSERAVVIGGGFIGCELAASMVSKGVKVTIVEVTPHILGKAIDERTSEWMKRYHESKGAVVMTQSKPVMIEGKEGRVTSVKLEDGRTLMADMVAIGVGINLNLEPLRSLGISIQNGVKVNERMQTEVKDIYAAGDIANFYLPLLERNMRVEHYDVAEKQGSVAGLNMAGEDAVYNEPPYFFSDQYDLNINAFGDLSHPSRIETKGKMSKEGFIQHYFEGDRLVGILAVNYDWDEIEREKEKIGLKKARVR